MAITPRSFFRNPLLLWAAVLSIAGMSYLFCDSNTSCAKRVKVKQAPIVKVETAPQIKHAKTGAVKQDRMTREQRRVASPTRGWLGVEIQTLTNCRAKYAGVSVNKGVLILDMQHGKPAQTAGFNTHDVVTHFNGTKVTTAQELIRAVSTTPPQTRTPVRVIRGDNEIVLYPTLTSSDDL